MNEKKEIRHNGDRRRSVLETHENSAAIQRDIEHTRREMTDTFNQIQHRLDAQHLIHHAADLVRDTMRQGTPRIIETVKRNPLPSSLIALGVGWILIKASSPQSAYGGETYRYTGLADYEREQLEDLTTDVYPGETISGTGPGPTERLKEKASDLVGQAQEKTSQWASQAKEKTSHLASQAKDKTSQMASHAKEKTSQMAGHLAEQTRQKAGHLGQMTAEQARRTNQQLRGVMNEYPLAVGACALAVGAAIGFSVPRTRPEDQMMGETSDQLKEKAKEAGRETVQKVQQVAETAQQSAAEEARRQGYSL